MQSLENEAHAAVWNGVKSKFLKHSTLALLAAFSLPPMNPQFLLLCLSVFGMLLLRGARAQEPADGVPVSYQLPQAGPLPQTYRVTLAIVDPQNTEWIVSQLCPPLQQTSVMPEA